MEFFKKLKNSLILVLLAALVLSVSFFSQPEPENKEDSKTLVIQETEDFIEKKTDEEIIVSAPGLLIEEKVPETKESLKSEAIIEEKASDSEEKKLLCTLSVRCHKAFENIEKIAPEKREIIPEKGIIFPETSLSFEEGETVFEVLKRTMRENSIHLDFNFTPATSSYYIKGIGNLYEFDGGELSGWLYFVNGKIPSFGCSQYVLKENDKIEFLYTMDMGADLF